MNTLEEALTANGIKWDPQVVERGRVDDFGCPGAGGGCGSLPGTRQELADTALALRVAKHPCYNEEAHHQYARMHIPVAPACNMQCNYCNRRYDCTNESRPGVTSGVLTPDQALARVVNVARRLPNLSVVGIAGPGDPLANPARTFRTFELVSELLPDVHLCLSTNGLRLPEFVEPIKRLGVDHVTITINSVDPAVGAELYRWIFWNHRRLRGREAAAVLQEQQLEGLRRLTDVGILCKVNSVLVPGVNEWHLPAVARTVRELGAFIHNVMPLIPCAGSVFGEQGVPSPSRRELAAVQEACGDAGIRLMKHCKQCRADAIGLLGEDLSAEFAAVEAGVNREWLRKLPGASEEGCQAPKGDRPRVAVATRGGGLVNQHFGHAREFAVYTADANGVCFLETRRVPQHCNGSEHCGDTEERLAAVTGLLSDCRALLCSRIGPGPRGALEAVGVKVIETCELIEVAVAQSLTPEPMMG